MSGAVKGKGVIMKIEIDREMTGLMQQIKDLNAQKAGLFCNNSFIYCHCSPFIYIHKWEYFS